MNLREKLPGTFILRRLDADRNPTGTYTTFQAADEESFDASLEAAFGRPHDGIDWQTGLVTLGGKNAFRVEFAGVLRQAAKSPSAGSSTLYRATGAGIEKNPLPRASHLRAIPVRKHRPKPGNPRRK